MEYEKNIGNSQIKVQIGRFASQASGSCFIKLGETSILSTAQYGPKKEGIDFFPLTCDYEEKYYAAGKILGSRFIRREGRPSTEAILISRAVDRSVRPLFPEGLNTEVQIIDTCLSWDGKNDPAILAILGASIAISVSEIPWNGPIGVVRVGRVDGKLIVNPTYEEREKSDFTLILSGIEEKGEILANMIEFQGEEVSENDFLQAVAFAKPFIKELISFQNEISKKEGKKKFEISLEKKEEGDVKGIVESYSEEIEKAIYQKNKEEYKAAMAAVKEKIISEIKEKYPEDDLTKQANSLIDQEIEKIFKKNVLLSEKRPDGRKLDEIRDIRTEVGVLPRTHGSGLFSRGETTALSILTIGAPGDQQLLEGMEVSGKKRFIHHYNFPPYSVGETRPLRGPGRREIGHGALAEKAIFPLIPSFDDFPYTIRVVSEIVSSNGSSSMASVSGATLALMDGGVPLKNPAAGIAIGLVRGENSYKILTDIQGPEDHYGDMDFKVAGTDEGITAIQMDVKINGISQKIIEEALSRAKMARLKIIEEIKKTINKPRPNLSPYAPRVYTLEINPEKIGAVIGPGGKMINEIIEDCGVSIDIEENGKIFITAEKDDAAEKAIKWIENITHEIKVGEIFQGKVKKIFNFGAVVEILPEQEGLVHISQFSQHRIGKIEDVVKVGDIIPVKVINVEENGKISLSAKDAGFKPKTVKSQR